MLGLCLEIDSFIRDEPEWGLPEIMISLKTSGFDIWRTIPSFRHAIDKKPRVLEQHLHELEIRIFLELAW